MPLTLISKAAQNLVDRFKVADLVSTSADLRLWLQSDFGRYLQARELEILQRYYSDLPGYRFLRLGLSEDIQTLNCFKHIHRLSMHPSELDGAHGALANYMELPLMSETIDVMLLQHALEFSKTPRAVLAEASRVVMPGGHLLLCMFNPFGPMGTAKFPMQLFSDKPQFRFHNLRLGRLTDWLSLLNFHVERIEHGAYNLPFGGLSKDQQIGDKSRWEQSCEKIRLPMGNFYMIHAVKRVSRGIRHPGKAWRAATTKSYRVSEGLKKL
ncbi:MAG: methyltransferase domain-containing protein [Porticoccaceae bacterium]